MIPHEDTQRSAAILPFRRKRGRPRIIRPNTDTGTPELVMKRLLGETAEALDLCLARDIITREQHWCGIHLRWLYTLRHGAPSVRAVDPAHMGGVESKPDDPAWRAAREVEYLEAIRKLSESGHALLIINICIYNERPAFLRHCGKKDYTKSIGSMRQGLDRLVTLWIKTRRSI